MTEFEWIVCRDPRPMLEFLRCKVGDRKLRLFAAASFQRLAFLLPDSRQHLGIEMLEQMAEGTASLETRRGVTRRVRHALSPSREWPENPAADDPYYPIFRTIRPAFSGDFGRASRGHASP
jgi:hypothetical protein